MESWVPRECGRYEALWSDVTVWPKSVRTCKNQSVYLMTDQRGMSSTCSASTDRILSAVPVLAHLCLITAASPHHSLVTLSSSWGRTYTHLSRFWPRGLVKFTIRSVIEHHSRHDRCERCLGSVGRYNFRASWVWHSQCVRLPLDQEIRYGWLLFFISSPARSTDYSTLLKESKLGSPGGTTSKSETNAALPSIKSNMPTSIFLRNSQTVWTATCWVVTNGLGQQSVFEIGAL